MLNPILKVRQYFIAYTGIWGLIAIIHILILTLFQGFSPGLAITESLIANLLFALIGLGLWFPVFFSNLEKESIINFIMKHLLACLLAVGLWVILHYTLMNALFSSNKEYMQFLVSSLPWRAGIGALFYGAIILVYYLIINYQNFRDKLTREAELKALIRESELNSLKSQINPHFLFNSLNSISSLTMISPEKAQEMIIKLSEFLRYSLSNKDEKLTALKDEIINLTRYLDIEKVRFGKRLNVVNKIDEKCFNHTLPGLILQPLVENAIKYGVYESIDQTDIQLSCTCSEKNLRVTIRNQFDPEFHHKKGTGIGIQNIRSRLKIMYGRDDLISLVKNGNIFEVTVVFPQT
ncbi:MAG: histidine kinase [Bacteroidales bacterium]|nr:histidine kinase [Bacteroidales bacterium]